MEVQSPRDQRGPRAGVEGPHGPQRDCKGDAGDGAIQDWGNYADSSGGYALWNDGGDTEAGLSKVLETTFMMMPSMTCDVRPVMDVDRARATIRQS